MTIGEAITYIALIAAGGGLILHSLGLFYKIRVIKNSDEIAISEAANRSDLVQINGRARKYDEILNSPIENQECISYQYDISKNTSESANPENNYKWKTLEEEKEVVDFVLEDRSGTAYIHTDRAEISLTNDARYTMSDSSAIPTTVASDTISFNPTTFDFDGKLRFREGTIRSGEWIFVIAKFGSRDTEEGTDIGTIPDGKMYISDKDTKEEISSLQKPAITEFIFGSVFLLFVVAYTVLELL